MLEATVLESPHAIGWPTSRSRSEDLDALECRVVHGLMEEPDELADRLVHEHPIL
jgi:hypothetical protein